VEDGTAVNETAPNATVNGTATLAPLTPSETATVGNITPYATPTPPRSVPAPVAGLFAAIAAVAVFSVRRSG
jgi:hypothetical protein